MAEKISKDKPFRILSLDGGGVRAVVQAVILSRIIKQYPDFLSQVDLFAGTSAGAIVASALCIGISPEETVRFYEDEVGKIFSEGLYNEIITMGNAIGACYSTSELQSMLLKEFGPKTLSELSQRIFIPTFKLSCAKEGNETEHVHNRWLPHYFHNLPNSTNSDTLLVDAVLRTTAAPTYFPIYQGYVDGGVVANNPSLLALTSALGSGITHLKDVTILSISTGSNPQFVDDYGTGNWGLVEWGPKIINLLLDSSTESTDYQCKCLINERYHRIDPVLEKNIPLDSASSVPELKEFAEKIDLSDTLDWIKKFWGTTQIPAYELVHMEDLVPPKTVDDTTNNWRCSIQ